MGTVSGKEIENYTVWAVTVVVSKKVHVGIVVVSADLEKCMTAVAMYMGDVAD